MELCRRGVAAVLLTLPYHLERSPKGTLSGQLAIVPDPNQLVATMNQSVLDVRRSVDWIQSRPELDPSSIGIYGTSLGSLVAELASAVEPRFSHAAFVLGGADFAHILWNSSRVVRERDALRRKGFTEDRLRERLRAIEPLEFLPKGRMKSAFVVSARFDTVIPPEDARKLIAALDKPKVLWLDTGHYGGFLIQKQVQKAVAEYFSKSFGGEEYTPPKRVTAPIIRLGVQANPETGLQVVAGVDIWRANAQADAFATLLATARGPQLFVGTKSERGLALGATALTGRVTLGLFWSTVL